MVIHELYEKYRWYCTRGDVVTTPVIRETCDTSHQGNVFATSQRQNVAMLCLEVASTSPWSHQLVTAMSHRSTGKFKSLQRVSEKSNMFDFTATSSRRLREL